jgi:hypothetical protein
MKHPYSLTCACPRCTKERARRSTQSTQSTHGNVDRSTAHVMLDWTTSRNPRRARVSREYWDAYEAGRPMSSDDY